MGILLDKDVIIEAMKDENSSSFRAINEALNKGKELFLSASILPIIEENLPTQQLKELFKDFLQKVKVITVTGANVKEALNYDDIGTYSSIFAFKRLFSNGIFLTKKQIQSLDGITPLSPEKFLQEETLSSNLDKKNIPMLDLAREYRELMLDIDEALLKVSASANYILGPEVSELERRIADFVGTKYAVGVSSGTDALVLALRALAIKTKGKEFFDEEDLIITTPFTFAATGEAILRAGATPLFVDIDLDTYNIDPEQVEKAVLKYGSRVKGILPVHLYGQPCNMDELMRIKNEYGLFMVEDCAQSLGARWNGKQTGSFGEIGCFSFFPTKPLGGFGDGGMVTTSDNNTYELLLMLRKHGGRNKYNIEHIGYNARLDTLQASILILKLNYINKFIERRRSIAELYTENLKNLWWLSTPNVEEKAFHVFHQYTIRVLNGSRNKLQKKLKGKNIASMVYYPVPLHKMKVFQNARIKIWGSLSKSEIASKTVLSLPIEPLFKENIIKAICEELKDF